MPFYLTHRDASADLSNVGSALIVPCRFCPAASLAVRDKKPYIQLFRTFLRTAAYEAYLREVKSHLGHVGVVDRGTRLLHLPPRGWWPAGPAHRALQ